MNVLKEIDPLFLPLLGKYGFIVLDGALATELESRGEDLNDSLWSARVLKENPELIKSVHLDYLRAGAQIITTSSYQASFPGFEKKGIGHDEALRLMKLSVALAEEAREEYLNEVGGGERPLIAASIGPYGAWLADGSEFRGDYGISKKELADFHRERMKVLLGTGADLLACETIPCLQEAEALADLLAEFPHARAWLSFSCRDGSHTHHGEPISDCAALAASSPQVIAMGINCTNPVFAESLIKISSIALRKPIIAYPNRGGTYDAQRKCWVDEHNGKKFSDYANSWLVAGATIIGGCCRTNPEDIREIVQLAN